MDRTHILKYDGYTVGDRLLDGVLFDVEIIESGETLTVGKTTPSPESESYLTNIRWENFVPAIEEDLDETIQRHMAWIAANGRTLREDMEIYAASAAEEEINVLKEV